MAFEAKEYARRLLIGRKVRVEIEFSREIPSKQENEVSMTLVFATLWLEDKNVSEQIVLNGFAKVNVPRVDEEFTKYL